MAGRRGPEVRALGSEETVRGFKSQPQQGGLFLLAFSSSYILSFFLSLSLSSVCTLSHNACRHVLQRDRLIMGSQKKR